MQLSKLVHVLAMTGNVVLGLGEQSVNGLFHLRFIHIIVVMSLLG